MSSGGKTGRIRLRLAILLGIATLAAVPHAHANDAEIVQILGRGDARESADADWRPAAVKQKLAAGAFVRTREMSQMGLLLRDQTQVRLNQLSILNIKTIAAAGQPTRLELPQGRAWSQAKQRGTEVAGQKSPVLQVGTPAGTADIRGTDWELVVEENGAATITVLSGEVEFHNEHGRVSLAANEQARATPGSAPVKIFLSSAAERVQWVTAYRPQPRRWVKAPSAELASVIGRIENGDYAAALAALRVQRSTEAALLHADLALFLGQPAEAIELLAPHARDGDADPMAAALAARAMLIAGRIDAAARLTASAAQRHPGHVEVLLARAEALRLQGDAPGALASARAAIAAESQNAEAWYTVGRIETEREFATAARDALGRALALQPQGAGYRGELGTLETFANEFGAADAAFRAALEAQPDDYVALTGLGVLQLKRGEPKAALESFLKAGILEPRHARSWLFAGVAWYQLGDRGRAIEAFDKAATLDEKDPLPHLMASVVHGDALEFGLAIEAARRAQARMPYLKSLNQVLNDQKGNANLGAALAAFGMEEWAQAYAYDSYSPYWSGSHLFLADRFAGAFNKNSELYKGYLSDPSVFGASNRFSPLVPAPGHYASFGLAAGRDYISEVGASLTLNGYSVAAAPFAYFLGYDRFDSNGESEINRTSANGRERQRGENLVLGLGLRPSHELGLFLYANTSHVDARSSDSVSGLIDVPFSIDYRRYDAGFNYKFSPANHAWLKVGAGSEHVPLAGAFFSQRSADLFNSVPLFGNRVQPLGRIDFDYEVSQSDAQWRHTFDATPTLQLSWGLEWAKQTKPFRLTTEFPLAPPLVLGARPPATSLRLPLTNDERLDSGLAYASARLRLSAAAEVQLELHYQDVKMSNITVTRIEIGTLTIPPVANALSAREKDWNPRLGVRWNFAPGHTLRAAVQQWRKPAGVNTLAAVDTLGVALDDQVERAGGLLQRLRLQHEIELGAQGLARWFADFKRVKNMPDPGVVSQLTLDQLEKLRNRRRTYALRADYLEDIPDFSEGRIDQFGVSLNRLLAREWSLAARYVYASTRNTGPEFGGRALPFHPRHYFNAGVNWQNRRWIVGPAATYRSARYRDEENLEPLAAGWAFGLFSYWESDDKRLSLTTVIDQVHSNKQSSIYRHPVVQVQAAYRF